MMRRTLALLLLLVPTSAAALPAAVGDWKRVAGPRRIAGKAIFDYMNGAAEVHRMYGFRSLRLWRYRAGEREIKVELIDLGSPAGAYGDFTHARDLEGEPVAVGQDGHHASGVLWFWKGRHLTCISSRSKGVDRVALTRLGRAVAATLRPGARPGLVDLLPRDGLRRRTVRYFRVPEALRYHYGGLAQSGRLGLDGKDVEAALADYRTAAGASVLLILRYPSDRRAVAVQRAMGSKLGKTAEGAWRGLARQGRLLRLVLEAPTAVEARRLLRGK